MSVASQQVPAYQMHKASGHAVAKLGGRVVYLGKFGSGESRVSYRCEVAQWQAQGGAARSEVVLVGHVIEGYWRHAEVDSSGAQPCAAPRVYPRRNES